MPTDQPPPDISDAAKIGLALTMLSIADRIVDAAADAPETMAPGDFADSLSDPAAVAVGQAVGNLFEGTHATNIASIATSQLRAQLSDPAFRRSHPYVMIVVTNPNARLSHAVMDGYVMTSEEAMYSPLLPPFDFGCDCVAIPISLEEAQASGLVGAAPAGTLAEFLRAKGVNQSPIPGRGFVAPGGEPISPGAAPGFVPAFSGTDMQSQLAALRAKAEEIRAEDAAAWAEIHAYLIWLFLGVDVLRTDPSGLQEQSRQEALATA